MNLSEMKKDYLFKLRKFNSMDTLEKIIARKEYELKGKELEAFFLASDHRKAEIIMNTLYDKVPKEVWRFVE